MFAGCFVEGETVLLLAGLAAHRGMLQFGQVAALAFVAGALGDRTFFRAGRRCGSALFRRLPRLARQLPGVRHLLDRHHGVLILSVRFLYGLRVAGPIAMGALRVGPRRFAWLHAVGAAVRALLIAWPGWQLGNMRELLFHDLRRIAQRVLGLLLLAGVAHGLAVLWRSRKR